MRFNGQNERALPVIDSANASACRTAKRAEATSAFALENFAFALRRVKQMLGHTYFRFLGKT